MRILKHFARHIPEVMRFSRSLILKSVYAAKRLRYGIFLEILRKAVKKCIYSALMGIKQSIKAR